MAEFASLMGCCMKKNNSILKRKTKIMSTKTKFIFLMSFLSLIIVGCVASMVIVLAAPKQKGILDVSIKYDAFAIQKEKEQFNGRDYYYIRMGEYPQTYAGAATSVTGLTETQEKFVCDMSTPASITATTIEENKEYNIWVDLQGYKYIKHRVTAYTKGPYLNGDTIVDSEEAFFKIEPIKWDILGYYTDETKNTFISITDAANFDPNHTKNLVVISRNGLQAIPWYPNSKTSDIDYDKSFLCSWLKTFENNVLEEHKDSKIEKVSNEFLDASLNTSHYGNVMAGSVDEYAWVMTSLQIDVFFDSIVERYTSPSDFALATYSFINGSYSTIYRDGICDMWLRNSFTYGDGYVVCFINSVGNLSSSYTDVTNYAVRPCLLVNL